VHARAGEQAGRDAMVLAAPALSLPALGAGADDGRKWGRRGRRLEMGWRRRGAAGDGEGGAAAERRMGIRVLARTKLKMQP
jgi:hypothetical protein